MATATCQVLETPFQAGPCDVRVLMPDPAGAPAGPYPVLYVLPVNPGAAGPWGSGFAAAEAANVADHYGVVCVEPTFTAMPWYANHPTDPTKQQERHLLEVVLPFVAAHCGAVADVNRRLLLGFSKSGWGACSLLLRHPELFLAAAVWDAPLAQHAPDAFGMGEIFGTIENFADYHVFALLTARAAALRQGPPRLHVAGYGNFRAQTAAAHEHLVALGIPHRYANTVARAHDWHSGWFAEAAASLLDPDASA